MASGNTMGQLLPRDFFTEAAGNPQAGEYALTKNGVFAGIGFVAGNTAFCDALIKLPGTYTGTGATGLTVYLLVAEDSTASPATGGNCTFGVNTFPSGSGSSYYTSAVTNIGTETLVTQAMPVTTNLGFAMEIAVAITSANLGAAGTGYPANSWIGVRVSRHGAASTDTCKSRIFLLAVSVKET